MFRIGVEAFRRITGGQSRRQRFPVRSFLANEVLEGAIVGPPQLTKSTVNSALNAANLKLDDVDIVQLHDAFAIEEIIYYELLGLCEPGQAEKLLEAGAFGPGSRAKFGLPEVSTDGGLIGRGHPGGPTGTAQIWETVGGCANPTATGWGCAICSAVARYASFRSISETNEVVALR